jgi:rRNA-processing protein FCF1
MQIIPDTNFLIYAAKYKLLDSLLDYDLLILEQVIKELEKISLEEKTKMKDRQAAMIALEFLKAQEPEIIKQEGKADDAIIAIAKEKKLPIATMDKEMITKAKRLKIKIIKLRQKKYLQN